MVVATGLEPALADLGVPDKVGHASTNFGQTPSQPGQPKEDTTVSNRVNRTNPDKVGTGQAQIRTQIHTNSAAGIPTPYQLKTRSNTPLGDQLARLIAACAALPTEARERLIDALQAKIDADDLGVCKRKSGP